MSRSLSCRTRKKQKQILCEMRWALPAAVRISTSVAMACPHDHVDARVAFLAATAVPELAIVHLLREGIRST